MYRDNAMQCEIARILARSGKGEVGDSSKRMSKMTAYSEQITLAEYPGKVWMIHTSIFDSKYFPNCEEYVVPDGVFLPLSALNGIAEEISVYRGKGRYSRIPVPAARDKVMAERIAAAKAQYEMSDHEAQVFVASRVGKDRLAWLNEEPVVRWALEIYRAAEPYRHMPRLWAEGMEEACHERSYGMPIGVVAQFILDRVGRSSGLSGPRKRASWALIQRLAGLEL